MDEPRRKVLQHIATKGPRAAGSSCRIKSEDAVDAELGEVYLPAVVREEDLLVAINGEPASSVDDIHHILGDWPLDWAMSLVLPG